MFRDLILRLDAIAYPLIGLVAFLFAFGVALIRALREPTSALDEKARLPLLDDRSTES
jgi:hypothetical protein